MFHFCSSGIWTHVFVKGRRFLNRNSDTIILGKILFPDFTRTRTVTNIRKLILQMPCNLI